MGPDPNDLRLGRLRRLGFVCHSSLLTPPHHTLQRTSPPTPARAAARPVITPREVVRMLVPSPPSTGGTSVLRKYTRRPGRLIRSTPVITFSPCGPYFRQIRTTCRGADALAASGDFSSMSLKPWI